MAIAATGCVDDKYDLSDIDTTTKLTVDDLVLPVNIEDVTLGNIITYDEDSKIKPINIDGKDVYALTESGSFSSKEIVIKSFTCAHPTLNSSEETLSQIMAENARRKAAGVADDFSCTYEIVNMGDDFNYAAQNIDPAIEQIDYAAIEPLVFKAHLTAMNVDGKVQSIVFTDLHIQMPKGLKIDKSSSDGEYDPETGLWVLARAEVTTGDPYLDAKLVAVGVNFEQAGCRIVNHNIDFEGEFKVLSGLLTIAPKLVNGVPVPLPENLRFRVDYTLTDMVITALTGRIQYNLDGMDIAPISLSDIPDFLSKPGTDIRLSNPQIYLSLNDPVGNYGLSYNSGLTLTAYRDNASAIPFPLGSEIVVNPDKGIAGPYDFVLSPSKDGLAVPDGYDINPEKDWIQYANLGNLLATADGATSTLPSSIGITLDNPRIPSQPVVDFKLATDETHSSPSCNKPGHIPGVEGKYKLVAPLALQDGSVITYSDKTDGWFSEDSEDNLVIEALTVTASADSDVPVAVELSAYPLDRNGNDIPDVKIVSTVKVNGQEYDHLLPDTNGQDLTIVMQIQNGQGKVQHVDGVRYEARIIGANNGEALSTDQQIVLKNIKARVSGYYITKF